MDIIKILVTIMLAPLGVAVFIFGCRLAYDAAEGLWRG